MMRDLPSEEKPREKAKKYGIEVLSNTELVALLFRTGKKNQSVMELSRNLVKQFSNFERIQDLRYASLASLSGVGEAKALSLLAALELGKRIYLKQEELPFKIIDTKMVYDYCKSFLEGETQEKFFCLFLDTQNHVLAKKILFVGTVDHSTVHSRDIFREAMLNNASKIICVHNHPSGKAFPSSEDIAFTKKIIKIGKMIGIFVIDHVIIGRNEFYSFLEHGRMDET